MHPDSTFPERPSAGRVRTGNRPVSARGPANQPTILSMRTARSHRSIPPLSKPANEGHRSGPSLGRCPKIVIPEVWRGRQGVHARRGGATRPLGRPHGAPASFGWTYSRSENASDRVHLAAGRWPDRETVIHGLIRHEMSVTAGPRFSPAGHLGRVDEGIFAAVRRPRKWNRLPRHRVSSQLPTDLMIPRRVIHSTHLECQPGNRRLQSLGRPQAESVSRPVVQHSGARRALHEPCWIM